MPQASAPNNNKKKKKGHAPAHQNKFAFYHNPKSKRTAEILERPIQHVCRRCHDKLEWRKQYRKYKPRTVLGKCNICQKKNIHAAYHTICESCTRTSEKARDLLAQWNTASGDQLDGDEPLVDKELSTEGDATYHNHSIPLEAAVEDDKPNPIIESDTYTPTIGQPTCCYTRVCAMCVKEPALPDPNVDNPEKDGAASSARLKLREKKTLERQKEREAEAKRKGKKKPLSSEEEEDEDDDSCEDDESIASEADDNFDERNAFDDIDEDDEFVKAIGGVDKLLIGNAYQAKLLEREVKRSC